jgi:hypothetical protein
MTEITADALEALPGEMPRQHISRLRKYLTALLNTLAEDDAARTPLQAALDDVDAILADAAHRAAGRLQAALVARMQDTAAESAPADAHEQVVDALDGVIPADAEGRAAVLAMVDQLLASAPQAPAPAVKAPAPKMRPPVPARRTDEAGHRTGGAQAAPAVAQRGAVPGVAPAPRAPGTRPAGGAPAAAARQPASTPTAGRPGPTGSSLGSLKRTSAPAERAEGPVDGAPAQPKRPGLKIHADGSVETERHMHLASGKIINKTTTKPKFVIPPMEPGDELIPW